MVKGSQVGLIQLQLRAFSSFFLTIPPPTNGFNRLALGNSPKRGSDTVIFLQACSDSKDTENMVSDNACRASPLYCIKQCPPVLFMVLICVLWDEKSHGDGHWEKFQPVPRTKPTATCLCRQGDSYPTWLLCCLCNRAGTALWLS